MARRVRPKLRRVPGAEAVANRIGLTLWRRMLRHARPALASGTQPWSIEVDPGLISRRVGGLEHVLAVTGAPRLREVIAEVRGGDWDSATTPLSHNPIFAAVHERFVLSREWEETAYYQEATAALARDEPHWKSRSMDDLERRLEKVDALHRTILTDGYQTQGRLQSGRPWDEVVVAIDREGRFLLVDGAHRLALAHTMGIERIPVVVSLRHQKWAAFCNEIEAYAANRGGRLYQPLPHPDLAYVPSGQGTERMDLIREHLPTTGGSVLDIGANYGAFCHAFEHLGFSCVAVERSTKEAYLLRRLRDAAERRFEIVNASIFEMDVHDRSFDITLALNIFHHFCKTSDGVRELESFLGRLRTSAMFFESHLPDDPQMRNAHLHLPPDEFAAFVAENAGLSAVVRIGDATAGRARPIYLLQR